MAEIYVEVAYGTPAEQSLLTVNVPVGSTVRDAIVASMICTLHPEIDPDVATTGIWGKPTSRGALVNDGDRVEIYRPLVMDPKEARRQRAKKGAAPNG